MLNLPVDPNFPGGGGGGNSDGSSSTPCNGNGVPTGPQAPASGIGYDSGDGCGSGIPTQPNIPNPGTADPCEKLTLENLKLKDFFQKTKFQGRLAEISADITTTTSEKSFSFGVGTSVSKPEAVTPIKVGYANVGAVGILPIYPNMRVYGGVHTHPKISDYRAFSAADILEFASGNRQYPDFQYYIMKAYDGSVYGLVITDWSALRNFFDNKSKEDYIDAENNFKITSDIGGEMRDIKSNFAKQGKTKHEAYELALAFVLKKYNMGLGLSKMDANGDFKPLFVNAVPDPNKPKKNIYEQTDNCNF